MPALYFMIVAVLVALIASFTVLFMDRTGFRSEVITHTRFDVIAKLFSCDFCLCFWTSLVFAVAFSAVTLDFVLLFTPLFSTPLARILL